ncbi:MAG: acyl-CoA synthetase [Pseudomonadales bacterium]
MGWNYGDILDALPVALEPEAPALIHDGQITTWQEFTARSNNLASRFLNRGVQAGDKVAFYLRNSPAYSETLAACFKARLVHVNVNYRYVDDELWYILDNSDSKIVVYDSEFADRIEGLRERLPDVGLWVEVTPQGAMPRAEFAVSYHELVEIGDGKPLNIKRSGDDLLFLYTGGTTGMPKGVMWAHDDHWRVGTAGALAAGGEAPATLAKHADNVKNAESRARLCPCCPMMHGTGLFTAIGALAQGGCVVTLTLPSFDPEELWDAIEAHKITGLAIVGDAFAKPMLRSLQAQDPARDLSSLVSIISSGVMWSPEVKQGLLQYNPQMVLTDSFGASEAVGFGRSDTTAEGGAEIAKFTLGEDCKVFTEDFQEVEPGSDQVGYVARGGPIPRGYYKDEEKTAKTFPVINGVRYSIPGDFCKVEADGTLVLLGRGSVCINTGGEKVFPEEVEEVLKTHSQVADALVVGMPDEKWGQMVTAVVQPESGASLDEDSLIAHVREHLAGYKTPKRILQKDDLARASNGKADYKAITEFAKSQLGIA